MSTGLWYTCLRLPLACKGNVEVYEISTLLNVPKRLISFFARYPPALSALRHQRPQSSSSRVASHTSRYKVQSAFQSLDKQRRLLHLYISQSHYDAFKKFGRPFPVKCGNPKVRNLEMPIQLLSLTLFLQPWRFIYIMCLCVCP